MLEYHARDRRFLRSPNFLRLRTHRFRHIGKKLQCGCRRTSVPAGTRVIARIQQYQAQHGHRMVHIGNRQCEGARLASEYALIRQIRFRPELHETCIFRRIHASHRICRICAPEAALASRRLRVHASGKFPANAFDFRIAEPALKIVVAECHRPRNAAIGKRTHELFDSGAHGCAGAFQRSFEPF